MLPFAFITIKILNKMLHDYEYFANNEHGKAIKKSERALCLIFKDVIQHEVYRHRRGC